MTPTLGATDIGKQNRINAAIHIVTYVPHFWYENKYFFAYGMFIV